MQNLLLIYCGIWCFYNLIVAIFWNRGWHFTMDEFFNLTTYGNFAFTYTLVAILCFQGIVYIFNI